jgi:hypothetical protein
MYYSVDVSLPLSRGTSWVEAKIERVEQPNKAMLAKVTDNPTAKSMGDERERLC